VQTKYSLLILKYFFRINFYAREKWSVIMQHKNRMSEELVLWERETERGGRR